MRDNTDLIIKGRILYVEDELYRSCTLFIENEKTAFMDISRRHILVNGILQLFLTRIKREDDEELKGLVSKYFDNESFRGPMHEVNDNFYQFCLDVNSILLKRFSGRAKRDPNKIN